ncbi:UBX domain-containing protein [Lachnellula suecica]|uniref:UBX domain-containing protein 2 n=1 Tax=Lachnellula suecica TaxID=602035 RepID=A0A8T9C3B7_9HELO|nr:UBX domain-containing protein [Lachnellula suecica]
MFYEGDLQSGISKAVEESRLVACFVTDDGEESKKWETEFLEQPELKASLVDQTVLLRLTAGSQEAGYLAAIFPLPKTPTIVVIKNGELKEYLAAGVTKEEFLRRMEVCLGSRVAEPPTAQAPQPPVSTAASSNEAISTPVHDQSPQVPQVAATSSSSQQPVGSSTRSQHSSADLLAERSARLEQREKDSKGKGKVPTESKPQNEPSQPAKSANAADMKYALMQKKRQQDAKEERARILKRVEDDKARRRQEAAERKVNANGTSTSQPPVTASSPTRSNHPSTRSAEAAVQVRLFDGSTVRSRFPSHGSLCEHVRPWLDEKQEGDVPYTFKQVLSPLPNKSISISEEEESLQVLGLTPSATLILVPINEYTSAYEGGATGLVYKGYSLVSSGVGMVTGALGSFLGGGAAPAQEAHESPAPSTAPSSSINVRTLRDQQRPDDQQFYNGNALNFEPRKDDDDKKED